MTDDEILAQVGDVIRDVLNDSSLQITAHTTAPNVPGWDSLAHVPIVVGIERHFKMRFSAREIRAFRDVGELCAVIRRRTS